MFEANSHLRAEVDRSEDLRSLCRHMPQTTFSVIKVKFCLNRAGITKVLGPSHSSNITFVTICRMVEARSMKCLLNLPMERRANPSRLQHHLRASIAHVGRNGEYNQHPVYIGQINEACLTVRVDDSNAAFIHTRNINLKLIRCP
jgi:hypothetical protein